MGCIQSKGDKYKVEKDGGDAADAVQDAKPADAARPAAPTTPGGASSKGIAAGGGGPQHIPVRTTGEVNNYAGSRPKLDPKDFQFVGLTGEVKVKPPGSINGQAFMIDKCEDCDLYLLDACGQVTVDDCKNCRIFVGPTEGSIFVRDSTGCKCVMVTRQFRVRDCTDCDVALLCRTRPIIESSSNIRFTCYDLNYPGLADHLKAVKLSPLHNAWSSVFDFTPKAETANFTLLPKETTAEGLLHPIPQAALDVIRPAGDAPAENPLIVTYGERPAEPGHEDSYMFLLFPAAKAPAGETFIREQAAKPHVTILFTNQAQVSADLAGKMAVFAKWSRAAERDIQDGKAVGVELLATEDYAGIFKKASSQHAYVTDREDAGSLFRLMGIDG